MVLIWTIYHPVSLTKRDLLYTPLFEYLSNKITSVLALCPPPKIVQLSDGAGSAVLNQNKEQDNLYLVLVIYFT